jgi:hypothetical protein
MFQNCVAAVSSTRLKLLEHAPQRVNASAGLQINDDVMNAGTCVTRDT